MGKHKNTNGKDLGTLAENVRALMAATADVVAL